MKDAGQRTKKWEENLIQNKFWATPLHQKIKDREARIISEANDHNFSSPVSVLELGCGDGYLGSKVLARNSKIKAWYFTDILSEALKKAKSNCRDKRAIFRLVDAYDLPKFLPRKSVSVIVSTGFASVGTYPGVIANVAATLKKNDLFIADFVNHFSLPMLPSLLKNSNNYFSRKYHHLGPIGIDKYFKNYQLAVIGRQWIYNPFYGPFMILAKKI